MYSSPNSFLSLSQGTWSLSNLWFLTWVTTDIYHFPSFRHNSKGTWIKTKGLEGVRVKVTMHPSTMQMVVHQNRSLLLNFTPQDVYLSKCCQTSRELSKAPVASIWTVTTECFYESFPVLLYTIFLCKDVVIGKFLNNFKKRSKDVQSITEALGTRKTFYNILRHSASEMNRHF